MRHFALFAVILLYSCYTGKKELQGFDHKGAEIVGSFITDKGDSAVIYRSREVIWKLDDPFYHRYDTFYIRKN